MIKERVEPTETHFHMRELACANVQTLQRGDANHLFGLMGACSKNSDQEI